MVALGIVRGGALPRVMLLALTAAFLAGCVTPNSPGQGRGAAYTPVIDLQGVESTRYYADLSECRRYSGQIDAVGEGMTGIITGAVLGAALAGALGGSARSVNNSAVLGGAYGGNQGVEAEKKQERIMINCMAGRGYRTLDGLVPVNYGAQPMPSQVPQATSAGPNVDTRGARIVIAPSPGDLPVKKDRGTEWPRAESVAKAAACHAEPVATLAVKGPGFESYSIPCTNGDTMMVRCEFGNCRVLK